MSKYLILFLFFMPFFFLELSCVTSLLFFLFFSRLFFFFFFFFFFELRCFSSLFAVGLFSFFILRGVAFVCFVFLFCFFLFFFFFLISYFPEALCVLSLSLSLDRLNKPLRNRFLIVLSRFSDRLRGTMVTQS